MFYLLVYCLGYYLIAGICTSIVYHRILAHHSANMVWPIKQIFVILGLPAGTPIQWVANHRHHHKYTDVIGDPHSPVVDGFWFSHCGWYISSKNPIICFVYAIAGPIRTFFDSFYRPRTNQQYNYLAKDISSNSFFAFVSKPLPYMILVQLSLFFNLGFVWYFWQLKGIVFLWITSVLIYNIGDSVDSFGHLFGDTLKDSKNSSRNNLVLGIIAFGDGWHANHHRYPWSAKHGIGKSQFDLSWKILKLFSYFKIVSNIKRNNHIL
jgi:stearoyl-CoA desaturase (delta-9 desaturase)